jgi:small subunit ribosomal protein S17
MSVEANVHKTEQADSDPTVADPVDTENAPTTGRGARKVRDGVVVSDKMDKTVVVLVERRVKHPRYHKTVTKSTRYKAHDEENQAGTGDRVRIVETRPLSKDKYFRLQQVLERAK